MKKLMLFSALLISSTKLLACSWWPEGDVVRFTLFSSHLGKGEDMSELFYCASLFNTYKVNEYTGPNENLIEWHKYFKGKYSMETIDQAIYRYNYSHRYYDTHEKRDIAIDKNALIKDFKKGKYKEASTYLFFAIQLEEYLQADPWGKKKMNIEGIEESVKFAEEELHQVKDEQIKLRYAYQLCVMNHYLNKHDEVAHYYINYVVPSPEESVLKSWAQFFYASTFDDYDETLYQWSRVFDESKSKCKYIFQQYPSKKEKLTNVLKKCKNDRERAAVLSILAFKNPGRAMEQIKEIADLNPNDELIDILLIREINKMEDWYLTEKYTGYNVSITNWYSSENKFDFINEKNFQSDKNYLKSFKTMCEDIVIKNKVENKGLWYTCIAYMAYMLDDQKETEKYLEWAKANTDDRAVEAQLAIIDILHLVKYDDDWGVDFQKNLIEKIRGIEDYEEDIYRYNRFFAQLMLAISRKYLEDGNLVLAALFESKVKVESEYYWEDNIYETYHTWSYENSGYQAFNLMNENATSKDLDKFFELWDEQQKTPLEKWLFSDMEKWRWRMTDLWATQYLREDNLEKSLKIYEEIPDSVWHVDNSELHYYYRQELDNDPFESNLYGRGYGPNMGKTYTKPEFVKEIIRLKKLIKNDHKDKSYYALLLGNAYYNMTFNGNSYYYTEYEWSGGGYVYDNYNRDQVHYFSGDRALEWYKKAEEWAPNKKYAAFCARMQLKCYRDSYYRLEYWKDRYENDWDRFAKRYPNHATKLKNCDHLIYYTDAWKQG